MSHIGCLCGNDVRENDYDNVWNFTSFALMNRYADTATFFDLNYVPGEKSEVWHCKECDRLILFDDGGNYVTRYMHQTSLTGTEEIRSAPDARSGLLYNEELFFDDVDEFVTKMAAAGKCPDYAFYSGDLAMEYMRGKPSSRQTS